MVLAIQLVLTACGMVSWWPLVRGRPIHANAAALPAWDQSPINALFAALIVVIGALFTSLALSSHPVLGAAGFPTALAVGAVLALMVTGGKIKELLCDFPRAPMMALLSLLRSAPFISIALYLGNRILGGHEEPAVELLRNAGASTKAIALVGAVVLAPIGEELFFRGMVYRWLRGRVPVLMAAVISAIAFSAFHMAPTAAPALFVFGFSAAYSAEVSGGLTTPILYHVFFNLLQAVFILAA